VRIALGQINSTVGDLCGNTRRRPAFVKRAAQAGQVASRSYHGAIAESVFPQPPSSELRSDQKDTDSIPERNILDQILKVHSESYQSSDKIVAAHYIPIELLRDVVYKVDRSEYKQQQAAPGPKVTTKAFGAGRRFPIAQRSSK
jgi:NH3-dependent NAD+ synthetase